MNTPDNKATFVPPAKGRRLETPGAALRLVFDASAGAPFSVVEFTAGPHFTAPPIPHHHTREHATFHGQQGQIQIIVEGTTYVLEPGALLHLPPHVNFQWANPYDAPARFVCTYSPAGFEEMLQELADAISANTGLGNSREVMAKVVPPLWKKYGIETQ